MLLKTSQNKRRIKMDNNNLDGLTDEEFEAAMNAEIAKPDEAEQEIDNQDEDNSLGSDVESNDDDNSSDSNVAADDSNTDSSGQDGIDEKDNNSDALATDDDVVDTTVDKELEQLDGNDTTDSNNTDGKDDNTDSKDDSDDKEPSEDDKSTDGEKETEQTDELDEKNSEPDEKIRMRTIRADGQEFEFTQAETDKLAEKGMNYTKKMQEIAPWRKTISALEDNEMTHEDVNLMIEAKKGNKEAMASMMNKAGVDVLDLNTEPEVEFKPKDYGKSVSQLDIEEIDKRLSSDKEYEVTRDVVGNRWDDASRDAMFDNPNILEKLHVDVKSGTYDKVAPIAMQLKTRDSLFGGGSKSDLEYYKQAGQTYFKQLKADQTTKEANDKANEELRVKAEAEAKVNAEKVSKAKADEKKRLETSEAAKGRKNAGTTKSGAGTKKSVTDYLSADGLSDDEFSEMMEKEVRRK